MYMFLSALSNYLPEVRIFHHITCRTGAAMITSLIIVFLCGPHIIVLLSNLQGRGQPIRADGPRTHLKKAGTPTMGGLIILSSVMISGLLWCNLFNIYFWVVLTVTLVFGIIGFYDDYLKVTQQSHKGFSGRMRICLEFLIAAIAAFIIMGIDSSGLSFPFFNHMLNIGLLFVPFAAFVIVGTSNAVNFTDGLDGLAIVPVMVASASFALIAYLAGNAVLSDYLQMYHVHGIGELTVLLGAVVGAGLGFLWFNVPPAAIFMGDTGSLSLGGLLGTIAVATKHEIFLIVIGGVFVIETLSVVIQVGFFRITGERFFLMAPIHHHFEKKGWTESQIVIRFWIISIIFALIGLATLNLR
ncbi:MAG: phospho-N-acetylmuramoyl-pentapeptide-transferase [Candidatus Tokpelaia sp. JSC085]|nr:MAG: phospho-N-acetylmuramoyl-pentapeptide-transferase [Candidatus Tokpelaia sp. JSC085]